ncbi:hypothetical protein ACWC9T_18460 [Kitasatospora sp. NPDC001159]
MILMPEGSMSLLVQANWPKSTTLSELKHFVVQHGHGLVLISLAIDSPGSADSGRTLFRPEDGFHG